MQKPLDTSQEVFYWILVFVKKRLKTILFTKATLIIAQNFEVNFTFNPGKLKK